jgi:hypothetical protein
MTADVHAAHRQALAGRRKNLRPLVRMINLADHLWSMLRRAGDMLAQLSPRERRDLGADRVREELNKWPWQG